VIPGQEVLQTTEIAIIGSTDSIEFAAEVDETDVVKITIGDRAKISLDALEDEELDSSVAEVGDISVSTETGATAYEVKMPVSTSYGLKIGMNGEAQIESDRASNVISIPIEAVIDDRYVYVFENGQYAKKEIETGLISETDIEVRQGLFAGQQVVTGGFDEIDKKSNLQKLLGIFR
jgi:HlyD family secretion protein